MVVSVSRSCSRGMADHIILSERDTPWEPSEGILEHVYFSHDGMPLAGLINQHETRHFFWCIEGEVTRGTLWGYAQLSPDESRSAEQFTSDVLKNYLLHRPGPIAVALSINGEGITKYGVIENEPGDFMKLVETAIPLSEEEAAALETV
jgi:hypothetical protein